MDMYQDIFIATMNQHPIPSRPDGAGSRNSQLDEPRAYKPVTQAEIKAAAEEANFSSHKHLTTIHRKIIDSIHQIDVGSQTTMYKVMMEARVEGLLMDEEAWNFYQYNLGMYPAEGVVYALSYLMKLANILLKEKVNKEKYYADLLKCLKKTIEKFQIKSGKDKGGTSGEDSANTLKTRKDCPELIKEFNDTCDMKTQEERDQEDAKDKEERQLAKKNLPDKMKQYEEEK